jgi:hypothetical protein
MSSSDALGHYLVKPATVGAVAYGAARYAYGGTATINVAGKRLGRATGLGLAIFGASILGELLNDKLFELDDKTNRFGKPLAEGVTIAANTAASAALVSLTNPTSLGQLGLPQLGMLNAVAEVAGDYLYSNFVNPMVLNRQ